MPNVKSSKFQKAGFALIELLVIIGIFGILLAVFLVAINPTRQFAQADNTKRVSDINTIISAVHQFSIDHKGVFPVNMPAKGAPAVEIKSGAVGNVGDICPDIIPTYISALPVDPEVNGGVAITDCTAAYNTGYFVSIDTAGRITGIADKTNLSVAPTKISITR